MLAPVSGGRVLGAGPTGPSAIFGAGCFHWTHPALVALSRRARTREVMAISPLCRRQTSRTSMASRSIAKNRAPSGLRPLAGTKTAG